MQFEHISPRGKRDIVMTAESSGSDEDILNAVLAAVYYHDTKFSGDLLLKCLSLASGSRRLGLMRIVETFMQMHRTDYLAPMFLAEMQKKDGSVSTINPEIDEIIDAVREFELMFRGNPHRICKNPPRS